MAVIEPPSPTGSDPCTVGVYSAPDRIRQLDEAVRRIVPDRDVTLEPRFFLASLSQQWKPAVVVVRRREATIGVVYARERTIAGFSTGLVYIDGRVGNMIAAAAADTRQVVSEAIRALFGKSGVRAIRIAVSPGSLEAEALEHLRALAPWDIAYGPLPPHELHSRLPLPADYQEFLAVLGYKTRRNFRYYRRKFEAAQHTWVESLSPEQFRQAATALRTKCHIRSSSSELERAFNLVLSVNERWVVGLRHRDGEWLSVAAGWFSRDRATMFLQLNNDREHADASLAIVLRAYLIEALIRAGVPELTFWSGSSAPLSRYAVSIPGVAVYLDARNAGWRLTRSAFGRTESLLAKWVGTDARWIAGFNLTREPPVLDHATARAKRSQSVNGETRRKD